MSGALDLWAHIFGDRHDTLELVSVKPNDWASALYGHFSYPDQVDAAERWLQTHSVGRNVYHCAHLLLSPKKTTGATPRTKDNASAVLTLWADLDGSPLPDDLPRPTAIVESSPGKMHCYWRLTRPLQAHDAERLNRRIAYAIKDDLSGWDLTQLLRPVGTFNWKYDTAQPVTITHLDPNARYDPIELAKLLPAAPDEAKPAAAVPDAVPVDLPDSVLIAMARDRQPKFARLWDGDLAEYIDDLHPEGDRSRAHAAFCTIAAGWTGKDPARIEAWWLTAPGLQSGSTSRPDYRARTIAFGISKCTWTYNPGELVAELDPAPADQVEPVQGSDGADGCRRCPEHCTSFPQLTAQVNHLLERERARDKLRKTGWSGEERAALEHLANRVADARQKKRDDFPLYYPKEKELSGVSPATFTRVINRIEAHQKIGDAVPFQVTREKTSNGKPQIRLTINQDGRFSGDLVALAALRRNDPQHGGDRRRCKTHPETDPKVEIIDQQLRRTIRRWVCPVDGLVLDEKHDTLEIVAETVLQVEQAASLHDETDDEEQDSASEAYAWKPTEPAPFQDETEPNAPVAPSCVYKGHDSETDSDPATVADFDRIFNVEYRETFGADPAPLHHETVRPEPPPPLINDPIYEQLDWASKLRRELERERLLSQRVAGGSE